MNHKSGYVAILGLPNAGKSSLLNSMLGQKLAITNLKPQTTRKKIVGILSERDYQIIFLDTPGLLTPSYLLQEKMMEEVARSIIDTDVVLLIIDVLKDPHGKSTFNQKYVKENLENKKGAIILLLNKVDLIQQKETVQLIEHFKSLNKFESVIPISASQNFNFITLVNTIVDLLTEGPGFYPKDIVAD